MKNEEFSIWTVSGDTAQKHTDCDFAKALEFSKARNYLVTSSYRSATEKSIQELEHISLNELFRQLNPVRSNKTRTFKVPITFYVEVPDSEDFPTDFLVENIGEAMQYMVDTMDDMNGFNFKHITIPMEISDTDRDDTAEVIVNSETKKRFNDSGLESDSADFPKDGFEIATDREPNNPYGEWVLAVIAGDESLGEYNYFSEQDREHDIEILETMFSFDRI